MFWRRSGGIGTESDQSSIRFQIPEKNLEKVLGGFGAI